MRKTEYNLRAKVWLYHGAGAWHFVTLPKRQSDMIKKIFAPIARGWGSLPVEVTIGHTSWKTSIFPDKKAGAYLLPLKADVRRKEDVRIGQTIAFAIRILV
jgi:hypothetical protein